MKTLSKNPDVLIIGAGPSGSIAAAMLAKAGHSAMVVERSTFPRFAIGESLLPQCMDMLEEAELLSAVQARNYQVKKGALFRRGDETCVIDFSRQYTKSWDTTFQVPRDDFDHTLAKAAKEKGAEIHFGVEVTAADFAGTQPTITVQPAGGGDQVEVTPRFVLDASGNAQVLPKLLNTQKTTQLELREAVFTQMSPDRGDPDMGKEYITILIHPDDAEVWYWLIPFADNRVSVGVIAKPEFLAAKAEQSEEQLKILLQDSPHTRVRLSESSFSFPPRVLRGYSHSVTRLFDEHYAILGNSGEFLDPVFSSGVTMAMKSSNLAAKALIRQFKGEAVDWQHDYADEFTHGVDVFKTFVRAWYEGSFQKFLFSDQKQDNYVRKVCSILAGYVWDRSNTLVNQHERSVRLMAEICDT